MPFTRALAPGFHAPGALLLTLALAGCASTAAPTSAPTPAEPTSPPASVTVERTVTEGLRAPWGLVTGASGPHLVSERDSGAIWRIEADGQRVELGVVPGVRAEGEGGLLGLALPPGTSADATEGVLYAYLTTETDNRVVRIAFDAQGLGSVEEIVTGIPRASIHNGGRIAFGPDGMLYVATGDAAAPELAQDRASLAGKVLRLTPDGQVPPDNPFADAASNEAMVFTLGHRNVQGLAFDDAGRVWASEFGTSIADELNVLVPGGNYGWPVVEGAAAQPPYLDPVAQWSPTSLASPSGIAFVGGPSPAVYVASLRGQVLWQVPVVGDRAGEPRALDLGELGRLRTVEAGGDGTLWLMTSNTDGRGEPGPQDDVLLELRVTADPLAD